MRFKSLIAVSLALVMALTLATPVLADTARGKLVPDASITDGAGSYVLKTNDYNNVMITVSARKLTPNAYYRVGWAQYEDGVLDSYIYQTVQANSRGSLKHSFLNGHVYSNSENWTFAAFVDSDYWVEAPWDLSGPQVALSFQ